MSDLTHISKWIFRSRIVLDSPESDSVGSKYTLSDLTLENAKLLVKLLSPETANIKNIFNQETLL